MAKTSEDFQAGQQVRCCDPEQFIQPLRGKLENRIGVIKKTTPAKRPNSEYCGLLNRVQVLWLKRNGRGKEFIEWMSPRDIELAP